MPPKATPLKVPTNGISSIPGPLTPRNTTTSNFTKPSETAISNEQSGETAVGNMSSPLELTSRYPSTATGEQVYRHVAASFRKEYEVSFCIEKKHEEGTDERLSAQTK
ncbi:hypothetical protein Clacol_007992 [Clathrus columnatus]|uniref:Uncharacterized protein n=1 Tax=Clathrus columnatus TaxID=1419009 RepID=A0AAV5ALC4_9AGAM|nr:hypothetical protein Clacol_007992 [Clathrus columnatus]